MVTNLNPSEEINDELYSIHDGSFPFPDLDDTCYISKKIVINQGKVIGCGLTRLTTEYTLLLNSNAARRVRVLAAQELYYKSIEEARRLGLKDTHIFTNSLSVAKFAEHLGFRECPEKKVLSLRFGYE